MLYNRYSRINCEYGSLFAGANSADGFIGIIDSIIRNNDCEKVYILKGGPGTGKSSFMKKIAVMSEKNGFEALRIYCSSDPDSLDGIIIKNQFHAAAVIDGTAPHTADPQYPGAFEEIINTGEFLNTDMLEEHLGFIKKAAAEKKNNFKRAYSYLKAAAEIDSQLRALTEQAVLHEKLDSAAARMLKKVPAHKNGYFSLNKVYTDAISIKGAVSAGFHDDAANKYCVADYCESASFLFGKIEEHLRNLNQKIVVSLSPVSKDFINALYIPEADMVISRAPESDDNCRSVNMRRFIDENIIAETKSRRRFALKCRESLWEGALDCLSCAGKNHGALEELYISAMDFDKLNEVNLKIFDKIKSRLEK